MENNAQNVTLKIKEFFRKFADSGDRSYISVGKIREVFHEVKLLGEVLSSDGLELLLVHAPKNNDGQIHIDQFVEWLWSDENCRLPSIATTDNLRVYWSGCQTESLKDARAAWFRDRFGMPSESNFSIKVSFPQFNDYYKLELPPTVLKFNVPNYGPNIGNAVMKLFSDPTIRLLATELKVAIPSYSLNEFVQGKMIKVHEMIEAARKREDCIGTNKEAIDRIEAFANEFQALKPSDINSMDDWKTFVGRHVSEGWEYNLHFDHILSNFGYSDASAKELRNQCFVWPDGEEVPFEQHALRWLSKAFAAYGPKGCMTDVVNLVFAMGGYVPTGLDEKGITKVIEDFGEKVSSGNMEGMWIPSHYVMDAETDDSLCWLFLEFLHRRMGTRVELFIQLPTDSSLDKLAADFAAHDNVTVFRDPAAINAEAIKRAYNLM